MGNLGTLTRTKRGKKRDVRVRFDGEIRCAFGVWNEEECRRFLLKLFCFLNKQGVVYEDWAILVTPKKGKE